MGSGFPNEKGWDGGIYGKKWAGKQDLRSLLGTLVFLYVLKDYTQSNMHTSKLKTSHSHNTFYKGEEIPIQDI